MSRVKWKFYFFLSLLATTLPFIMVLVIHTLLPVACFHCCFLVLLRSERDYDTTICICEIYSLSFYGILSFSYFPLPPRQKNQTPQLHYKEDRVAPEEVTEPVETLSLEVVMTWLDKAATALIQCWQ